MFNINSVTIGGNTCRDPELRYTPGGTAVTNLSIASNRSRKDKDDEVVFIDVVCWNKTAEIVVDQVKQGTPVTVQGRLSMSKWTDQATGAARSKIEITADIVTIHGKLERQNRDSSSQESPQNYNQEQPANPGSDTPF